MIYGRDMEKEEIIGNRRVIHPAYKALYPAKLVVPLVDKTFEHNKKEWGYDTNMGLFLLNEPQNNAEGRALFAGRLNGRSWLGGRNVLGGSVGRSVGVALDFAEGARKYLCIKNK